MDFFVCSEVTLDRLVYRYINDSKGQKNYWYVSVYYGINNTRRTYQKEHIADWKIFKFGVIELDIPITKRSICSKIYIEKRFR